MFILLVEDDVDIQEILLEEFTLSGHKIDVASEFISAMNLLKENKYELVLSDYEIPNGNGLQILEHVNTLKEKPLFFLISAEIHLELNELLALGVDQYYQKPFNFEEILQAIEKISSKRK